MHLRNTKSITRSIARGLAWLVLASVLVASLVLPAPVFSGGVEPAPPGGSGRVSQVDGITVVSLSGSPREIGWWHGKLLGDRMLETEAAFRKLMPPIPGGAVGEWLVRMFIRLQLGRIESHLTDSELAEMKGMAESGPDGSRGYRDLLYYHVLQDIGQNYACTGGAAVARSVVAGRNFDMNKDGVLDPLKTVFFYNPDDGCSYATVAWPGMVGAVTGMNEHGLCVMVFSARSENASLSGVPVAFLARRVLAQAADVDAAVEIIKSARRMGPNTFLIADPRGAAAVEFDSDYVDVRKPEGGILAAANHFVCDAFASDGKNAHQAKYTDSRQRMERMKRLLAARRPADAPAMVGALRDHSGPDGRYLAWGDAASINNIKDAHSVVFEPARRKFWISAPPSAYGEFKGFKLTGAGISSVQDLPASEYTASDEGLAAVDSHGMLMNCEALTDDGSSEDAKACAWQAMGIDPSNYLAAIRYAALCMEDYHYAEAYEAFDSAVMHAPACYPAMADALAGRGEAARKLGMHEQARSDFMEALGMDCSEDANKTAYNGLKFL